MFTQLKKLLSNDAAPRSARRLDGRPTRAWQFERLEDRSMLSASMGQMPMNDIGFEMYDHAQPMFVAGMFAPMPMDHDAMIGDGYFDQPAERYDPRNNIGVAWDGVGQAPPHSNIAQGSANPNGLATTPLGATPLNKGPTGDSLSYTRSPAGVVTLYDVKNTGATPVKGNDPQSQINQNKLPGGPGSGGGRPGGSSSGVLPPAVSSELYAASAVGSELIAREAESAATTNILDTAFQSYTSQLLLGNVSVATQSSLAKVSNDQSTPTGEAFEDFIALSDTPTSDSQSAPVDAVANERAAVDAVLRNLQDLRELPSDLDYSSSAENVGDGDRTEQSADAAFDAAEQMLAESQGGMVLLRAVGDANEGPISLVNVVEAQRDLPIPHIGVQASIGFYQAIDIGIEELTAAERIPAPAPSLESAPHAKPNNRYSKQQNAASSGNAAAVIGASTLAGALLWCVDRGQTEDEQTAEADAEKRLHAGTST